MNIDISIPQYLYDEYDKTRQEFLDTYKKVPGTFTHYDNPAAEKYSEENFPREFYGEQIGGIVFEAWCLRSIIESSFNAGMLYGKDPVAWEANNKKVKELMLKMDMFVLNFGKRHYHIKSIQELCLKGDKVSFISEGIKGNEVQLPVEQFIAERDKLIKRMSK